MKIKVANKKWATPSQQRCLKKLADHVVSHYPKDAGLHRAVKQALGAMDDAAKTLKQGAKSAPRRRKAVRTTRRRAVRKVARRKGARRTTRKVAKRTTRKAARRTTRRAAPRRARRRTVRRRTARRA